MKYSFQKHDLEKTDKPKPVLVLQMIAWGYVIIGIFFVILNASGFSLTNFDLMMALALLMAGAQTFLIGTVVHSAYIHKLHKQNHQ